MAASQSDLHESINISLAQSPLGWITCTGEPPVFGSSLLLVVCFGGNIECGRVADVDDTWAEQV